MPKTYGGFTINDIVYYVGLAIGAAATAAVLRSQGWQPGLPYMLISLAVGVGVGYVCEELYKRSTRRLPPQDPPVSGRKDDW